MYSTLLTTGARFGDLALFLRRAEATELADKIDQLRAPAYFRTGEILETIQAERGFVDLAPLEIVHDGLIALELGYNTSQHFCDQNADLLEK